MNELMSNDGIQVSLDPEAAFDKIDEGGRLLPGDLFGGRQAWRPKKELRPESESTRFIKSVVLFVLFLFYVMAGEILLHSWIDPTSLNRILAIIFVPPLFAVLICVLSSWVLFPGHGLSIRLKGDRKR
jgi:hypothetical protein